MNTSESDSTRCLAEAYGLDPSATPEMIVESIINRTPIIGGTDVTTSVLEVVATALKDPAWSALVSKSVLPASTVTGMIAAADQHKPSIAAAKIVDIVIHDIQQALAHGTGHPPVI